MKTITSNGDYLVYFHPFHIMSNVFIKNGTYPLMFIGRIYYSMRNGTYPLMFIGRVYNTVINGYFIIILSLASFSCEHLLAIFHRSLSDSKSPQVSRIHLSILANLNNAVSWVVSIFQVHFQSLLRLFQVCYRNSYHYHLSPVGCGCRIY